jgi:hypothetical protein
MKKIIVLVGIVIAMASCEKKNCNCGVIQSDNAADYSIVIRNSCTGNNGTFQLSPGDWMNAHPGEDYCITNVESW